MQVKFWGHACIEVTTASHSVIFDPYLSGNPQAKGVDLDSIKVDAILVSHGHGDHFGDTIALAKRNDAVVVGVAELAGYVGRQGVRTHAMHIGGAHEFPFGWVKLTPAWHGSSLVVGDQIVYLGNPCGFLYRADGKTVYFAGDTGLFGDMELIGKLHPIDVAFLPIGDNYVMGPDDAVVAAKMLGAKLVVPMHYNTFPLVKQDPQDYARRLEALGIQCKVMAPGEKLDL